MKEIQHSLADLEENQTESKTGYKNKSRKVKTRRAKRKLHLPYHKFSESEIKRKEDREEKRKLSLLERMKAKEENVSTYTEAKLMSNVVTDQYCYQAEHSWSKEDREEFICKEFQKDYEIQQLDRLEKMSKEMLMNEYLSLESKTDYLERKLTSIQRGKIKSSKISCDPYLTESIIFFRKELAVLKEENQKLTYENTVLSSRLHCVTSTFHPEEGDTSYNDKLLRQDSRSDDTGYESSLC